VLSSAQVKANRWRFLHFFIFFELWACMGMGYSGDFCCRKILTMRLLPPPKILTKIATGRNVLLLLLLFVAFSAGIMPAMEADIKALSDGVGVLDLQFYYSPETARSMLESYGPEGIRLYLMAQWSVDLVFPIIAGLLFSTCLCWLGAKNWWLLGPILTAADWTENIFITILLLRFPIFSQETAWAACIFTMLKWGTVLFGYGPIIYFGGKKLLAIWKIRLVASRN